MEKNKNQVYIPSPEILSKYADVLVNFSLNQGKGLQRKETVGLRLWKQAQPMRDHILKSVRKAGGQLADNFMPINMFEAKNFTYMNETREYYKLYSKEILETIDHEMLIMGDLYNPQSETSDPALLSIFQDIKNNYDRMRAEKMKIGKLGYSLSFFPTQSMADDSWLTLEEYRDEFIRACYLDQDNPKEKRREIFSQLHGNRDKLTNMEIKSLHIKGEDVDLIVKLWANRKWLWWTWRNLPSYETFVSPDWRGTEWWIKFSQPVYDKWRLIDGIELHFKAGRVIKASAKVWDDVLQTLLQTENFDKIGEFSLTDKDFSPIRKYMANPLFGENIGGKFGNIHIALGNAYKDSYNGDYTKLSNDELSAEWFNVCDLHIDMISTNKNTVTAKLWGSNKKIIYKNWKLILD